MNLLSEKRYFAGPIYAQLVWQNACMYSTLAIVFRLKHRSKERKRDRLKKKERTKERKQARRHRTLLCSVGVRVVVVYLCSTRPAGTTRTSEAVTGVRVPFHTFGWSAIAPVYCTRTFRALLYLAAASSCFQFEMPWSMDGSRDSVQRRRSTKFRSFIHSPFLFDPLCQFVVQRTVHGNLNTHDDWSIDPSFSS